MWPSVIPNPPIGMHAPHVANLVFTIVGIGVAVLALVYALGLSRRMRTPLPVIVFASGSLAAVILEPILDVNGGCWWPRTGSWDAYHLYGTPIPVWALAAYFWFVGGQALVIWQVLRKAATPRRMWACWAGVMVVNFALETPGLLLDIYAYWGEQPLKTPWGLPLWWLPVNACMPLVAGFIVYKLEPVLTGARMLMAIPLVPAAAGMAEGASGTPAWLVLNSDVPAAITQLGGLAVFVLAASVVWALSLMLDPVPQAGTPAQREASTRPITV